MAEIELEKFTDGDDIDVGYDHSPSFSEPKVQRNTMALATFGFSVAAFVLALIAVCIALYIGRNDIFSSSVEDDCEPGTNCGAGSHPNGEGGGPPKGDTWRLWYDPAKNATQPTDIPEFNKRASESTTVVPGAPTLGFSLDGNVKVFRLYAQPIDQVIYDNTDYERLHSVIPEENRYSSSPVPNTDVDKFSIHAWGYNGQHPGPLIEVNQYDTIRIVLHNELVEPTSLHVHGLVHAWEMDGTGGISQPPVQPGQNFTYEFRVDQCGTYFYHSGTFSAKQLSMGLVGPFVSHCYVDEPAVDVDIYILLSAFEVQTRGTAPSPQLFPDDVNLVTLNGKSAPSIPVWTAKAGDLVRFRVSDPISNMHPHPMHLHGHAWIGYAMDGGQIPHGLLPDRAHPYTTLVLAGGKTYDVIFTANPGVWRFHCHLPSDMVNRKGYLRRNPMAQMEEGGMFTYFCVEGQTLTKNITCPKTQLSSGNRGGSKGNIKAQNER